jgi:histidinol-phosphatase (PHP family)
MVEKLSTTCAGDRHLHPDYSIDAKGSIEEFCRVAFDRGLVEVCFTTHYDDDPQLMGKAGFMIIDGEKIPVSKETVHPYLESVQAANEKYCGIGLMVKGGLEFGYFSGCRKSHKDIIDSFPLDFRLCGVHNIDGLNIAGRSESQKLFEKYPLDRLADLYFGLLDDAAATGLYDCLAHVDLYRRYGMAHYGDAIKTIHQGRIEKLFETMKRNDVGLEINTSGLRHGLDEYYPGMDIINRARRAGVEIVALGSDAHRPEDVGYDFDFAATIAYELFPYVDE